MLHRRQMGANRGVFCTLIRPLMTMIARTKQSGADGTYCHEIGGAMAWKHSVPTWKQAGGLESVFLLFCLVLDYFYYLNIVYSYYFVYLRPD